MKPHPFTIARTPQGYALIIPGAEPRTYRRKRDALSYGIEHRLTRQPIG